MTLQLRTTLLGATLLTLAGLVPPAGQAAAAPTTFRVTDLDLRDPHTFFDFIGCRDLTDVVIVGFSFNSRIQSAIHSDADMDGYLDLNLLLMFDPVAPGSPGGYALVGGPGCTAPAASTTCGGWLGEPFQLVPYANSSSDPCLEALPGTVRPYSPAVLATAAPCFATGEMDLLLGLGDGIFLPLRSARIGATYQEGPGGGLVAGLIRGFLREVDANNLPLPGDYPIAGGEPFASLLPGGDPPGANNANCAAHDDRDLGPDGVTPGWWMYFSFTAAPVPYVEGLSGIPEASRPPHRLVASPNPFRTSVSIEVRQEATGPATVTVLDVQGRRIATLHEGALAEGGHRFSWDGSGPGGRAAAPGLYFVRAAIGDRIESRRVLYLP